MISISWPVAASCKAPPYAQALQNLGANTAMHRGIKDPNESIIHQFICHCKMKEVHFLNKIYFIE